MKNILKDLYINPRWYGGKLEINPYFTSVALLFVLIMGALTGGGRALNQVLNTSFSTDFSMMVNGIFIVWIYLLAETIMGAKTVWVAIGHALLSLLLLVGCFALGYVLSIVIVMIVTIIAAFVLIGAALTASVKDWLKGGSENSSGSSRGPGGIYLWTEGADGGTVELTDKGGGYYSGSDGNMYRKTGAGFRPEDFTKD